MDVEAAGQLDRMAKTLAKPGRKEPAEGSSLFLSLGTAVCAECSGLQEPSHAPEQDLTDIRALSTHPQDADGLPRPAALEGVWPGQVTKTVKGSEPPANPREMETNTGGQGGISTLCVAESPPRCWWTFSLPRAVNSLASQVTKGGHHFPAGYGADNETDGSPNTTPTHSPAAASSKPVSLHLAK